MLVLDWVTHHMTLIMNGLVATLQLQQAGQADPVVLKLLLYWTPYLLTGFNRLLGCSDDFSHADTVFRLSCSDTAGI